MMIAPKMYFIGIVPVVYHYSFLTLKQIYMNLDVADTLICLDMLIDVWILLKIIFPTAFLSLLYIYLLAYPVL